MKFFSVIFFFVFIIMASSTKLLDSPLYVTGLRKDDEPCIIPFIYRPVCGSDGETYSNNYALECEQKKNPATQRGYVDVNLLNSVQRRVS
ncbi:hypothetical protein Avbf_17184 [Armadillidium vulgare]|nr:hypothetical protein Avbf_17184 [Armadillidium vulgare]